MNNDRYISPQIKKIWQIKYQKVDKTYQKEICIGKAPRKHKEKMDKIKVAFGYKAYPFTIANYFLHALKKRTDVELFVFGEYFGDWIPWGGGIRIPMKYVEKINLPLPQSINNPTWEMIKSKIPWKPDLILCCDAGFHLSSKPDSLYSIVLTDPHVLSEWYENGNRLADFVFGMQKYYLKEGQAHLPYCCSPDHHYVMNGARDYDASLIGLHYPQRDALVAALRSEGLKVLYDLGLVYDEYREWNNRAKIGLNWSSLMDINARTFEIMAMKQVPLINRLPHLQELGLEEGKHYFGFDTVEEAVFQAKWILSNFYKAMVVAQNAHDLVHEKHTYDLRVEKILEEVGLND